MQQINNNTFGKATMSGLAGSECLRPFSYSWKRLARTSGMQQHTEQRSVRNGSKLSVLTLATVERPPPSSLVRHRASSQHLKPSVRQQALLQESILEQAPSQTNADGRSNQGLQASAPATQGRACTSSDMCTLVPFFCRWINLFSGLVQLCQHHAWCGHAVHSLCFERGKLKWPS